MAFSSHVTQESSGGNPGSAYKLAWQDNSSSTPCFMHRDFGLAAANGVKFSSDFQCNTVMSKRRAGWGVMRDATGAGISVAIDSDPTLGNTITIARTTGWNEYGTIVVRETTPHLLDTSWYRMEISAYKVDANRLTVSATLKFGDVVLHTIATTTTTEIGGFCGFFGMAYDQLNATSFALFDNIRVETIAGQGLVKTNIVNAPEVSGQDLLTGVWVGPFIATGPELQSNSIGIDLTLPRGLTVGKSISWKVQARLINDFEQAIGSWFVLASEVYNTAKATPIRLSFDYPTPDGRYQIRVQRTDTRDDSADVAHDLSWQGMRAELTIQGVTCTTATYVIGRIRASDQLSGLSQRRISVLSNRMIPVWDGTSWSPNAVTRSAMWAMADVLRNSVYGRKLSDDQIDLATMLALDAVLAARQDRFDMSFDSEATTWDALSTILRGSRSVPLIRGSRYTVVRDSLQTLPVAMYGMRNIKSQSFSIEYLLPEVDQMDALDFEYWDLRRWDWVIVTAQIYNKTLYAYRGDSSRPTDVPEPQQRVKMQLTGVIGENQAKREVIYHLADTYYRRRRATYISELDGLLPAYGSLVLVHHDVPGWGQGGDVWAYDESTRTVSTTEPLHWEDFGTHFMRIQKPTGDLTPAIVVTKGGNDHEAILASSPGFDVVTDDGGRERPRYIFGPSTNQGAACRVKALKPRDNFEVQHIVIMEDDRVHLADAPWLPGTDIQDPISDGSSVGDDATSSGDYLVTLVNHDVSAGGVSHSGGVTHSAAFSIVNDGSASALGDGIGTTYASEWLEANPYTTATTALFEVLATHTSGTALTSGTLGTWENCATTRTWTFEAVEPIDGTPMSDSCTIVVQIRDVATATVQSIATIRFTIVTVPEIAGGGE